MDGRDKPGHDGYCGLMTAYSSGEDDLIARYFKPLATDPGTFGLTDDAAVLGSSGEDIVVTVDAVVESVHFLTNDPPDTLARKALRVNLSDLAAKGAEPAGFVLTLALRDVQESWLAPFAKALGEDATHFKCPLLGGDTVSTPGPLSISITVFGRVPKGRMVRRFGAKAGDLVMVTGTIGDATLGLDILRGGEIAKAMANDATGMAALIDRYRVPQPRNALALAVREHAAAAMDLSDGLAGDLTKFCNVSGVSADVRLADVPLSAQARELVANGIVGMEHLASGGDDYELLCAVPPAAAGRFAAAAKAAGTVATVIGEFRPGGEPLRFLDASGTPVALKRLSYSHF